MATHVSPSSWTSRAFIAAVSLAAVGRLYMFTGPLDGEHVFRQAQTLMMTESFQKWHASWFAPMLRIDGVQPRAAVLELPLYNWLAAVWLNMPGGALVGSRIVSFSAGVAAIWLFYRICQLVGVRRARAATLLFAFCPLVFFFSHAVQPDGLMLTLALGAAYLWLVSRPSAWTVAGAAVCLALAATVKPGAALAVGVPVVICAGRRRALAAAVVVVVAGLAVLAWGVWDRSVLMASWPGWYLVNTRRDWLFGPLALRWSGGFYGTLAIRLLLEDVPPFGLAMVVVAARHRAGPRFWWGWLAGALFTVLLFAELNLIHNYYQLLLMPPLCALMADAFPMSRARRWQAALGVGLASILAAASVITLAHYSEDLSARAAGAALGQLTRRGEAVGVVTTEGPYFPVVLYYADRGGWNVGADALGDLERRQPPVCAVAIMTKQVGDNVSLSSAWSPVLNGPGFRIAKRAGRGCG